VKILRICQETPFPPTDGVRIEPYFVTKLLASRGHKVTLVCFQSGDRDVMPLRNYCELYTVPSSGRNTALHFLWGAVEGYPVNYIKYRDKRLLAIVAGLLQGEHFDVVVVDYSALGWFALQIKRQFPSTRVVTRWLNYDTLIWERWTGSQHNSVKRLLGRIQTAFVRRLENELASVSDLCLVVGARDAELIQEMAPTANVEFLPAGVDIDHYAFQSLPARRDLLFMASSFKWHANHDAVAWLHGEIMPRIWARHPGTVLHITGADHTPEMRKWGSDGRVVLTGFVPDEREVAALCSILVVPMRLGAGIKLKILTALAMGKAVVTTSHGAEGVAGLEENTNCLIGDSSGDFADAVIRVLDDIPLQQRLATNGRRLVCERYDWEVIVGQFESLLESVVGRQRHSEPLHV